MAEPRVLQLLGPSTGGIRRHVAHLATELRATGWDVAVAGPEPVVDGRHLAVPVPGGIEPVQALQARAALARAAGSFDIVHAHGLKAGWLATTLRRRPPVVVTLHNVVLDEAAGRAAPLLRALEARLPGRADAVIAVSSGIAQQFAGRPGAHGIVVVPPVGPPAVPTRPPDDVRAALGAAGRPLVVVAARLHPQKGLDTLIDAAAVLRRRVPGVLVAVVGEGPLEATLRASISRAGLGDTVVLAGPSPHAVDELGAADVVAVPSRWESGPLVVAEAMQLGRPVVATPVGFVPDLIEDGRTGRIVPVGDAGALAAALAELLDRPEEAARIGAAGRARVADRLDPRRLVAAVADVYRATLEQP